MRKSERLLQTDVDCPRRTCGALAGQKCLSAYGYRKARVHAPRRMAWEQAKREAERKRWEGRNG